MKTIKTFSFFYFFLLGGLLTVSHVSFAMQEVAKNYSSEQQGQLLLLINVTLKNTENQTIKQIVETTLLITPNIDLPIRQDFTEWSKKYDKNKESFLADLENAQKLLQQPSKDNQPLQNNKSKNKRCIVS